MIGNAVDRVSKRLFRPVIGQYERLLAREVTGDCRTLLDIGCGAGSPVQHLSGRLAYSVGLDAYLPDLLASKRAGIHTDYIMARIAEAEQALRPKSFDCVVALDVIEHLPKPEGHRLLALMERTARKKVIIMTPNGFLPQEPVDGNTYQRHVSGWSHREMAGLGFRVMGINGLRQLRGDRTRIKWQPHLLWENLSYASQLVTLRLPRYAYQLLCVKELHPSQNPES